MKKEEKRKKEEGRRKKKKVDGDSLQQATSCLQTSTNCQHRLDRN
ncbi:MULTISPECIES: hypothetical protein [unclassified Okeania]|nr:MULTISPECIES: hypothetical protein [unclassified Okeania]